MQLCGKAAWKSAPLIANFTLCRAAAGSEPWQQHQELEIQRPCCHVLQDHHSQAVLAGPWRGDGTQDTQAAPAGGMSQMCGAEVPPGVLEDAVRMTHKPHLQQTLPHSWVGGASMRLLLALGLLFVPPLG